MTDASRGFSARSDAACGGLGVWAAFPWGKLSLGEECWRPRGSGSSVAW